MSINLLRNLSLRQLQIFEAVVRLGGVGKAAEELFVSQPTISIQLKTLAETLGEPIFEKAGRSLRPTAVGQDLYTCCRSIFRSLDDLETAISERHGLARGHLRLAVVTTAKYIAPELLGAFGESYPGIDLSLQVNNRDRILERIQNAEDDIYIMGEPPQEDLSIVSVAFALNPIVVMVAANHPLLDKGRIPLADLAQQPFLFREPGSGTRKATMRVFEQKHFHPHIRMELGSNEAIKHAIVGHLGIAVLSLHSLALEGADGPIRVLDVEGFPILRQWYLVYPKERPLSLAAQAFLDFARKKENEISEQLLHGWPAMKKSLA
ncbi:LysR family transcriptional regulator [Acidithiobacillus sp. IBUN Pt1247-S3]|uniref:LysR family transcriptional regulator n=1 Tax=Acidithiobacillus sp. IBUN Pt1247-S3 TaxID=3166642 RepID=UPI0034E47FD5